MTNEEKIILLQACEYTPDKVLELVEMAWSENKVNFYLIFEK